MARCSDYESEQLQEIEKWKAEEPGVVSMAMGKITAPLTWLVQQVIPRQAIEGALTGSAWLADRLVGRGSILRQGGVQAIEELRTKPMEFCDSLADKTQAWAVGMAVVEGGGTGAAGLLGILVDIPTSVTLALRSIQRVGLCYGFDGNTEQDRQFILGVLGAAGANTLVEKTAALATLRSIEVTIAKLTWKKITEEAAAKQFGKEAAIVAVRNLAKQLGVNLTKRKALMVIPVVGVGVGAAVNGWFIRDVCLAARRAFQERWLFENGKLPDDASSPSPGQRRANPRSTTGATESEQPSV